MPSDRLEGSVTIPERFNGPPDSGNGGFVCGVVARSLDSECAEVSLRHPPPLGRPLSIERDRGRVALHDGDLLIAEGERASRVAVEPPQLVGVAEARRASRRYPWFDKHAFPSCFVCGPERSRGDGLDLFTGPVDGSGVFAGLWVPAAEWDRDGRVRDEIVWAALDCPSAVPVMPEDPRFAPAVLARLSVSIEASVIPERPHVVVAWIVGSEGRKRHSASAILGEDGAVLARARALWIELRR